MPDWRLLREAYTAGLPETDRLAPCRRLEALLSLATDDALAGLEKELDTPDLARLYWNLTFVALAVQRDAGSHPITEEIAALSSFRTKVQQGVIAETTPGIDQRLVTACRLLDAIKAKHPMVDQPASAAALAKAKLQNAASDIFRRMDVIYPQTLPGTVTAESIGAIEAIIANARSLIASTAPDNEGLHDLFSLTGGCVRTLAACYLIAGRTGDAIQTLDQAASDFDQTEDPAEAANCRAQAADLRQRLTGNLDAAASIPLAMLNAMVPARDPFDLVAPLMKLADIAREADDTFESQEKAETAATALRALGYLDPGQCGAEAAMDSWIAAATAGLQGLPMLHRMTDVETFYRNILSARYAVLVGNHDPGAEPLNDLAQQMEKLNAASLQEAMNGKAEAMEALHRYFPGAPAAQPAKPLNAGFPNFMEQCRAIDNALLAIADACNQRVGTDGDDMADLIAQSRQLQAQADLLHSPEYEAKTRLTETYVLYQLNRGSDLIPIAREARRRLLAGKPATLSSFPFAYQRYLYLDSLDREVQGQIMGGDSAAGLELSEATIRDFETERYQVNSEYRQSAMLGYVADFYKWAALLAFKLKKWDNMLEAIDLIKARSAIRSRLIPDPPAFFGSEVERAFAALHAEKDGDKRRQLWDLLSIERAQNASAGELPTLTVPALQAALGQEEALIAYFWIADTVLLTVAVDRVRFHAERIIFQPEQLDALNEFVAFIQQLTGYHNMDSVVAQLGEILLPGFLRDFMKTKKRITFSPHHALHLFPFHAARWGDGFVGTEFAVGYVPNFSSVLLPWNKRPENRSLLIAIKDFANGAAPSLTNVENDAAAIQGYYEAAGMGVQTLLGADASRARIESMRADGELSKFRCVHLGTHGLSVFETPDQPLESQLFLQDGALDAMDIANLRIDAELVVMSACHSGQRAIQMRNLGELPGDDIFGLQSALFKSGVRSILGTLWLVETNSASAITRGFHKYFAAGEPAEVALQQAVKEYLSNAASQRGVFYWAPYFLVSLGSRPQGRN